MSLKDEILQRTELLHKIKSLQIVPFTEAVREQADVIASGSIYFYEVTPVEIGLKKVDWSGKHIDHQEWPAQLNRFMYLGKLASAYQETREEKYAEAARGYIEDWISGWDYANSKELRPGDNTLNMSIRMGSSVHSGWGGSIPHFLESKIFDEAFLKKVILSLGGQAEFLERNLSAINNWRVSQLDAILFTALHFPQLEDNNRLTESVLPKLRNALSAQFLRDGVHTERCNGYHTWMARVAANYYHIGKCCPEARIGVTPEQLRNSWDYAVQGAFSAFNDAHACYVDPDKAPHLEDRAAILRDAKLGEEDPPLNQVFEDAGYVFTRSGFAAGDEYLAFDAGTWGGGHCHLSRLAFSYRNGGQALVTDSGILNYEMSDPYASYGKGTSAHSTLNVNGLNQSGCDGILHLAEFSDDVALINGSYQGGYWEGEMKWRFEDGRGKGVYGRHERTLLLVRGEYLLILDNMETDSGQTINNVLQFAPMDSWELNEASYEWHSSNEGQNLMAKMLLIPDETSVRCYDGDEKALRGWVAQHGNDHQAAPQLEFSYQSQGSPAGISSAVLLAPFAGEAVSFETVDTGCSDDGHTQYLVFRRTDGGRDCIAWSKRMEIALEYGPVNSDGGLVWVREDISGQPVKLFAAGATHVAYRDKVLLDDSEKQTGQINL